MSKWEKGRSQTWKGEWGGNLQKGRWTVQLNKQRKFTLTPGFKKLFLKVIPVLFKNYRHSISAFQNNREVLKNLRKTRWSFSFLAAHLSIFFSLFSQIIYNLAFAFHIFWNFTAHRLRVTALDDHSNWERRHTLFWNFDSTAPSQFTKDVVRVVNWNLDVNWHLTIRGQMTCHKLL